MTTLDILYQDNHLLVVNKPAGIATMGAESGPTVHSLAADYLKRAFDKPGKAYVGVVSRLDAMTSGVIVLARTSKAAARLSAQFAGKIDNAVTKIYLAAVEGPLEPQRGELIDFVRKDDAAHRMRVVDSSDVGAQEARLRYLSVGKSDDTSIVAVRLLTGRKHQIRVQFSERGHPLLGDRKYESTRRFSAGVALHSWRLQIIHPTKKEPIWFQADLPASWKSFQGILPGASELRERSAELLDLPPNNDCE